MKTSQEPSLIRRSNQQRKNENENLEGLDKPKEANYKYPKANVPLPETKSKDQEHITINVVIHLK